MIKINLSNEKKSFDLSDVGGFDFSQMNFKAVGIVTLLLFAPDYTLIPHWEETLSEAKSKIAVKQSELAKLKREVAESEKLEKQIRDLQAQEENLEKKLTAVKQAIQVKSNPASLLLYIAKNIPPELWINELDISDGRMNIKGEALDYTSIGNFVNSLRSSVFIKDANINSTSSQVRDSDKRRIETFEVNFGITRLDQ